MRLKNLGLNFSATFFMFFKPNLVRFNWIFCTFRFISLADMMENNSFHGSSFLSMWKFLLKPGAWWIPLGSVSVFIPISSLFVIHFIVLYKNLLAFVDKMLNETQTECFSPWARLLTTHCNMRPWATFPPYVFSYSFFYWTFNNFLNCFLSVVLESKFCF